VITIVVPTLGRPSLGQLLCALAVPTPTGVRVLVVDDRRPPAGPLPVPPLPGTTITVVPGPGRGPAAARNAGWRRADTAWVAFLDDDVLPDPDWLSRLRADLTTAVDDVGGVQGRLRVPLPPGRPPTDWERCTAGLATGEWITADMAYRRAALVAAGGFDERFHRAYREDTELAHRVRAAGWRLVVGSRTVAHPVRPESFWVSLRTQRGNADDALLRRLYGPDWRAVLRLPRGRRGRHLAVTTAALTGVLAGAALLARWPVPRVATGAALLSGAGWAAGTAEFAWSRIKPGPRGWREVAAMLATSVAIPPAAAVWWSIGWWRHRYANPPGAR
jgi:hypothetical protein